MPRGDGTGPMGMGSMSGRAAGYCAGYGMAGVATVPAARGTAGFGPGRGFMGRGSRGGGRGWRHWFYATGQPGWMRAGVYPRVDAGLEKQTLKNQAEALQSQLDSIKQRLSELESGAEPHST